MTGFGVTLGSLELGLGDSIWWLVALVILATVYGAMASALARPASFQALPMESAPPWAVITAVCTAGAVVWFPAAGLAGGLPAVGLGLNASQSELQWIADSYPLVLTALLLPAGAFIDRFGRRRGMLLGLAGLVIGLVWCAYANSSGSMIAARIFCAAASALIFPATLATLTSALPERYQDKAVAIWAGSITIGSGFGLMGALGLLEAYWWGSMFLGMAGSTALAFVLVAAAVPETKADESKRFDFPGAFLGVLGPGGLVLGLTEGPIHGWTDPLTVGALVVGAVALTGFLVRGFTCSYALLDARVFRNRRVLGSSIALIVIFTVDFAIFFLFFQFRGFGFGEGTFTTAWLLMTAAGAFVPATLYGVPIAERWGMRLLAVLSFSLCAAGIGLLGVVDQDTSSWVLVLALILFWTGVGGMMTPATQGILKSLPAAEQGMASAVNDIVREFGAAIGIALFGSIYYAGYRSEVGDLAGSVSPDLAESLRSSPGAGLADLAASGGSLDRVQVVQNSVIEGFHVAMWFGVGVLLVGMLIICACLPKRVRPERSTAPEKELALLPEPELVGGLETVA